MIAYSISALVLLILANVFPFLSFEASGQVASTSLLTGVHRLWLQGMWPLALLVLLTTVLFPLIQLLFVLYIFVPLKYAHIAPQAAYVYRFTLVMQDWNMVDVFLLGIVVTVVKLIDMATIVPGIALWSFVTMILILAALNASFDRDSFWDNVDAQRN